jgi:hypothetical protein
MKALAEWENFYVIVGSSAGALIGLQFVVITLIAGRPVVTDQAQAGEAFATPTVVHFGAVLLLSAIAAAPWPELGGPSIVWGLLGLIGIVYEIGVAQRMRAQSVYTPQLEDWLFHVLLPFAAYATVTASACAIRVNASIAMFGIGAAALLLLFIGIHNAWDGVTYHIFVNKGGEE